MTSLNSLAPSLTSLSEIYSAYLAGAYSSITLTDVLSAIEADADRVITRRHPLGFTHAELTPCVGAPVGERFRLHFWLDDSGTRDDLGDLHEHTWHLTSLVLAGGVSDSTLRASPVLTGKYQGSRIIYGEQTSSELVGRFDLETVQTRRVDAGSVYTIPSRTVHLNSVVTVPTVTLVHSIEDNRGEGPLVFNAQSEDAISATPVRAQVNTLGALHELEVALGHSEGPSRRSQS